MKALFRPVGRWIRSMSCISGGFSTDPFDSDRDSISVSAFVSDYDRDEADDGETVNMCGQLDDVDGGEVVDQYEPGMDLQAAMAELRALQMYAVIARRPLSPIAEVDEAELEHDEPARARVTFDEFLMRLGPELVEQDDIVHDDVSDEIVEVADDEDELEHDEPARGRVTFDEFLMRLGPEVVEQDDIVNDDASDEIVEVVGDEDKLEHDEPARARVTFDEFLMRLGPEVVEQDDIVHDDASDEIVEVADDEDELDYDEPARPRVPLNEFLMRRGVVDDMDDEIVEVADDADNLQAAMVEVRALQMYAAIAGRPLSPIAEVDEDLLLEQEEVTRVRVTLRDLFMRSPVVHYDGRARRSRWTRAVRCFS